MDGTLVDSVAGVTAAWEIFAKRYPDKDINVKDILSSAFCLVASFTFGAYNPHGSQQLMASGPLKTSAGSVVSKTQTSLR